MAIPMAVLVVQVLDRYFLIFLSLNIVYGQISNDIKLLLVNNDNRN